MNKLSRTYLRNICWILPKIFLQKLNEFSPQKNQVTVSFDVISLFTNVPLAETIELIANYIYAKDNPSYPPFSTDIFVKIMFKATQGLFMYQDELYQQIIGVTMGSPLGPTFLLIFIADLETKLTNKLETPKLYLWHVDDIFAIFDDIFAIIDDQQTCSSFFQQLKAQHQDIKLTVEQSTNTLSFLMWKLG